MSGIIHFDSSDVARLIIHAVDTPERQPTWDERLTEGARQRGVDVDDIPIEEWSEVADSVTDFDPGPALMFVHDQGLYVMSNGHPSMEDEDPHRVIYAHGFDPKLNSFDEWWEGAREIVGGDDFVEGLPLDEKQIQTARYVLAGQWPSPSFFIEVDGDMLSFGFELPQEG